MVNIQQKNVCNWLYSQHHNEFFQERILGVDLIVKSHG